MNISSEGKVILASSSVTRREILRRVGLDLMVVASNLDESASKFVAKTNKASPSKLAAQLAEAKAAAVELNYLGHWIIGADQVLSCGEIWLDKAYNREDARKKLAFLSGRYHELHTAACVVQNSIVQWRYVDTAKLWMRPLTRDFIEGYLDQVGDKVLSSVGCYQIEGVGAQLFDQVQGDQFSIQGMPLIPLLAFLRSRGLMPK